MNKLNKKFSEELAIRVDEANPNHHIWNNNGTWWLHYTVYPTPITAERKRKSLRTKSVSLARQKRDKFLISLFSDTSLVAA